MKNQLFPQELSADCLQFDFMTAQTVEPGTLDGTTAAPNYRMVCDDGGYTTEDFHAVDVEDAMRQARQWMEGVNWWQGDQGYRIEYSVRALDAEDDVLDMAYYRVSALPAPKCKFRRAEGNMYWGVREDEESGHAWKETESSPRSSGHGELEHTDCCVRCGMVRTTDHGATSENGTAATKTTYAEATEEAAAEAAKWRGDAQEDEEDEASMSI